MNGSPRTATAAGPPTGEQVQGAAGLLGAGLLWFGVLGGPVAWIVHLFAAWGVVEVACTQGNTEVLGLSLRAFAAVWTAGPGVLALFSLAAALSAAHREAGRTGRSRERTRFLAHVGAWLDGLSLTMIIFGAVALILFEPCSI